jgi:hypothetical protein
LYSKFFVSGERFRFYRARGIRSIFFHFKKHLKSKPAKEIHKFGALHNRDAHCTQQQLSPIAGKQLFMSYQVLDKSFPFYNLVGTIPQLGLAADRYAAFKNQHTN